jgi:hypothetical protein
MNMEDLKKKFIEELRMEKEEMNFQLETNFKEEQGFTSIREVDHQDVLNYYEKKHRKDMEDLMRFIRG